MNPASSAVDRRLAAPRRSALLFVLAACATVIATGSNAARAAFPAATCLGEPLLAREDGIVRLELLPPNPNGPQHSEGDMIRLRDGRIPIGGKPQRFAVTSVTPARGDAYPAGTRRIAFTSAHDGADDWALFLPGDSRKNAVVYLHGSFSEADQVFTRQDVRDFWLTRIRRGGHALLSVNMRGTSYMSPAATADLTDLLGYCRARLNCRRFVLLGGSGGASSAMAYAVLHPEQIHGVVAMGMCDIVARLDFARRSDQPVLQKLAKAVFAAYGGTLEEKPELYRARSVLARADRLTMPVILTMGEADPLIPVAETRKIAAAMKGRGNFVYHEIPHGNHDAALWVDIDLETLRIRK